MTMSPAKPETGEHHEGGCLCGAIRYRVDGPIDSVGHCHCGMCRRSSGALVLTWFDVPRERFAVTKGELAWRRSSAHGERSFCRDCGAQITFRSTRNPNEVDVTLGTLDHPERHPADRHVFVSDRLPWLHLDEDLPAHPAHTPGEGAG